ncbi:UNVERIFIED_CONTAM: hypothetical protein HDU68_011815 [Siphonaria sp. JEL0065]|nr:hypothetical protein HDU68_011815 [Siphonaria sp. JEL0065]
MAPIYRSLITADPWDELVEDSYLCIDVLSITPNQALSIYFYLRHEIDLSCQNSRILTWAAGYNHFHVVQLLLPVLGIDPTVECLAFRFAIVRGHLEVVKLLFCDPRVDPSANDDIAIKCAVYYSRPAIVKLLLTDPTVDPTVDNDFAVITACETGNMEILQRLLAHPAVHVEARNNLAFQYAAKGGHLDIVKLLLSLDKVDPSANNNSAIAQASQNGHLEVVKTLLSDSRVDPSAHDDRCLLLASRNGHVEVAKLLLSDSRVSLRNQHDLSPLTHACEFNHTEVVRVLLKDPRLETSPVSDVHLSFCLQRAVAFGNVEMLRLLLEKHHSVSSFTIEGFIQLAQESGLVEVVKVLNDYNSKNLFKCIVQGIFGYHPA